MGKMNAGLALASMGVKHQNTVYANLSAARLIEIALERGEGRLSEDGALVVGTGAHTGRSVQGKFSATDLDGIAASVGGYHQAYDLFVQDLLAGADPEHRVRVRLVTTSAWHALFTRNMLIRPTEAEPVDLAPDYIILHAPRMSINPTELSIRSSTVVALSFDQRLVVIAGTEYAGEIKESVFTIMNWLLPERGVLPMHYAANRTETGRRVPIREPS